jgi:hypothetical protein
VRAAAARLFQPRAPFSLLYSLAVDVHYMLDDGTPCDKSAPGAVKHVTGGAAAKGANSGFGGERGRRRRAAAVASVGL